jgi:outer membrane biosynthesis protein TonB
LSARVRALVAYLAPRLRALAAYLAPRLRALAAYLAPRLRALAAYLSARVRALAGSCRKLYHEAPGPSRLKLGVAAGSLAALAGVLAGVAVTAAPSAGAASPAATVHAAAGHLDTASGPANWSWRSALAASPVQAQLASKAAVQAPDAAQHAAAPARPAAPAAPARPAAPAAPARPAAPAAPAAPARPAAPAKPAAPAPAAQPYLIYDSVQPTAIPAGSNMATYATGPYSATPSETAGASHVMWIDVYGTDYNASALDVEPSDATPAQAADWAYNRLRLYPHALAHIYTNISEWPEVQQACAWLPASMQARIRWWIADPTGVPHLVPGSQATQWYWGQNYDISTAAPDF